ncbi:hypothetical protein ACJMK2_036451 [Sinanodonta woodiana]|uniref:Sodium/calcium exchanger membrane region domain-containing protein n=1 Tax=Sinanodonta woodiana TaxID=1069815 RepID=A0ABD3WH91_SINWO
MDDLDSSNGFNTLMSMLTASVSEADDPLSNDGTRTLSTLIQSTLSTSPWSNITDGNISTPVTEKCTHPAYSEFPSDAFTVEQRAHGAIIFHILFVIYIFISLAIVCNEYFVSSLDRICEKLGFSEDVAGATFMAAGSSAPELFTALIGVFVTKGDVGVGTIVGSAVFNILFVIGVCGILVKEAIALSWWPLCRDSICYCIAIIVLILIVSDGVVTWYESLIMLILYAAYIVMMRFNRTLQSIVTQKMKWLTTEKLNINGFLGKSMTKFQGDYEVFENDDVFLHSNQNPNAVGSGPTLPVDEYVRNNMPSIGFYGNMFRLLMRRQYRPITRFRFATRVVILYNLKMKQDTAYMKRQQFKKAAKMSSVRSYTKSVRNWCSMTQEGENFDAWRTKPSFDDGYYNFFAWALCYPIRTLYYYTIPDCRKERWEKWFFATFFVSVFWIGVLSYVMVWMVTLAGFAFHIPDSVMGITFLAAGTSIPDAMASVFVARQGMGDMAVSNSVGSNVFDILLGLSLPWFLKTAIVSANSTVTINSNGMLYSIILLFLTVMITIGAIHFNGWILNKCVGFICLTVYAVYLAFSIMIECNVFGFVNPPMCSA